MRSIRESIESNPVGHRTDEKVRELMHLQVSFI